MLQGRGSQCHASRAQQHSKDVAKTLAAYELLGLSQDDEKATIRAAYIQKMKLLHPDVNSKNDTTAAAAAVVAAYKHLLEVSSISMRGQLCSILQD